MSGSLSSPAFLTQGGLLQQVQVAGEELVPHGMEQMEGHAVHAHGIVSLPPAARERLVGALELHLGLRAHV